MTPRLLLVALASLALLACTVEPEADVAEPAPVLQTSPPSTDEIVALEELPCTWGKECADAGPHLRGTCCTVGDNLVPVGKADAIEAVDLESDGDYVWACGGFGVRVTRVTNPQRSRRIGANNWRCQRIALGPHLEDGTRIFWLAHHGDSWIPTPGLRTFHLRPDDTLQEIDRIADRDIRFEGILHADGWLWAAAHDGGLRTYSVDDQGAPTLVAVSTGFGNAQKLALRGDRLYVTDDEGIVVVDVSDPARPVGVQEIRTSGAPVDVALSEDRLFAALGSRGVDVLDLDEDGTPTLVANLPTAGSSQAVAVHDGLLAVADWSHVSLLDAETLGRLASERTRPYPDFEQDLGVTWVGDLLAVAEWEDVHLLEYRPGYVGAELHVDADLLAFDATEPSTGRLSVRNRGPLELVVDDLVASDEAFGVSPKELRLEPGESAEVEVTFAPPGPEVTRQTLTLESNDPDPVRGSRLVPLHALDSDRLDVGDSILSEEFGFLDPTGERDYRNLEGRVLVLAYFALF